MAQEQAVERRCDVLKARRGRVNQRSWRRLFLVLRPCCFFDWDRTRPLLLAAVACDAMQWLETWLGTRRDGARVGQVSRGSRSRVSVRFPASLSAQQDEVKSQFSVAQAEFSDEPSDTSQVVGNQAR